MTGPTPSRRRTLSVTALAVVVGAGMAAAGCGSSGSSGAARPASAPAPTTAARTTVTAGAPPTPPVGATVPGPEDPCGVATGPPAHYRHVVWIWMENHSWSSVIGSPDAPYVTALARRCGTDVDWSSVGSPSLPNYLGATSGSTQGVTDDGDPSEHSFAADNVFRQVRDAGGTERSYVESMPSPCALVSAGSYAAKHNPAVYYDGPGDRAACGRDDVPFGGPGGFADALGSASFPTFASVTPNICDDMHSCPTAVGDRWLATWVPRLLANPAYRSGTTAVFIVWDEPSPVADVVIAPSVTPATETEAAVDQYSLLRTTEEMLGLPLLGQAASARSLRPVFGI